MLLRTLLTMYDRHKEELADHERQELVNIMTGRRPERVRQALAYLQRRVQTATGGKNNER